METQLKPLHIVELNIEAVKRIKAVHISPAGKVIVLSGRNGQGKTSVLDSIEYTLNGKPSASEPIRRGEESARIVCHLGEMVVTRRFTKSGSTLTIDTPDGKRYASPQKVLDELVGPLSSDPLKFMRMEPKQQAEELRKIAGIDLAGIEQRRAKAYEERTLVNRDVKTLQANLEGKQLHADTPETPIDVRALHVEYDRAVRHNADIREHQRRVEGLEAEAHRIRARIEEAKAQIAKMEAAADSVTKEAEALRANSPGEPLEVASIQRQIEQSSEVNARVAHNQMVRQITARIEAKQAEADALTAAVKAAEKEKVDAVAAAKMPVEGLGFGDGIVTFGGIPLSQASGAEQLRVSVAIAIAQNPRLRVLLVRDASLLDQDGLRLIAEMAEQHNVQVWLERVEVDDATTLVIEDGEIKA